MTDSVSRGNKKKFHINWALAGVLFAMAATVLSMGVYHFLKNNAPVIPENPLEDQLTADMFVEQSYVLYHDLMQKQTPETLSYKEIYVKPREGCDWVLDKSRYESYITGEMQRTDEWWETEEEPETEDPQAMDPDDTAGQTEVHEATAPRNSQECARVYNYLNYLEEDYFKPLSTRFSSQINYNFDYFCEDLSTGVTLTNIAGNGIVPEEQYFYLELLFDEYGNCEIGTVRLGRDASLFRKYVSASARTKSLEEDGAYQNYDDISYGVPLENFFTLGRPENCRIVYAVSNADWSRIGAGEKEFRLNTSNYNYTVSAYYQYVLNGVKSVLFLLFLIVGGLAFILPVGMKMRAQPYEDPAAWFLRLPAEVLFCVAYIGIFGGLSLCFHVLSATLDGSDVSILAMRAAYLSRDQITLLVYGINVLLQFALFFFVWYIGIYLREVRRLGVRDYVKKRSLIYRFFPFMRSMAGKFFEELEHFDLTKKSNRMILRVVLINGIILCLISTLWVGGWGFAVIYSVLLYFFLRRFVSRLQHNYAKLLRATNEIAMGNLNVQINEDLGVFEPFKPQVYRIRDGFKKAVEEEMKSQHMKTELITNVSHDLKTPLTAIITYIDLLKDESITQEQRREYLDTLERKSLRLKVLIEDLFEVSKANSQNMTLNLMDVDLMNLVRQVAVEMEDKFKERELDLRMSLAPEKTVLQLDSQRTYRIYENLFGNIAKYSMPGTRVYVNGYREEGQVVVVLKNISAEEISVNPEELTERFVRGDISRNTEGSGLGLAIAKSFTELQGGALEIGMDGDLFKVTTVWKD